MEFFQFHPTGIYKLGILITEGVRGEGGVLINGKGERFMAKYAPNVKDLASRRCGQPRHLHGNPRGQRRQRAELRLPGRAPGDVSTKYAAVDGRTNLDGTPYTVTGEEILTKLPDIVDFCRVYLGVDPVTQMMPIQPTAHYTMGGIPTNKYGEVVSDEKNTRRPRPVRSRRMRLRLRARRQPAGHQFAARPGGLRQTRRPEGGRICQRRRLRDSAGGPDRIRPGTDSSAFVRRDGKENAFDIATEMKKIMFDDVGIFRNDKGMQNALEVIRELQGALPARHA